MTCSLPVAATLPLPALVVGGTLVGPSRNTNTSCGPAETLGPEGIFRLDIPEQTDVALTVTASSRFAVALRRACDDLRTELACKTGDPAGPATLRAPLGPGTYWVVVDLVDDGASGSNYMLTLASNGTCKDAVPIAENAAVFGNAATVFGDLANGAPAPAPLTCPTEGGLGNILYYRAAVPPAGTLVAQARGSDVAQPLPIAISTDCASTQCLANAVGEARYSNVGTAAAEVIIKVGSGSTSGSFPFELQVSTVPLGAGGAAGTGGAGGTAGQGGSAGAAGAGGSGGKGGGGGGAQGGADGGAGKCATATMTVSGDLGHVPSDLTGLVNQINGDDPNDAPTDPYYLAAAGGGGHTHTIMFTDAQIATLRSGGMVTVMSTTTEGGAHQVTVSCTTG